VKVKKINNVKLSYGLSIIRTHKGYTWSSIMAEYGLDNIDVTQSFIKELRRFLFQPDNSMYSTPTEEYQSKIEVPVIQRTTQKEVNVSNNSTVRKLAIQR
jgi:hypothetical protein